MPLKRIIEFLRNCSVDEREVGRRWGGGPDKNGILLTVLNKLIVTTIRKVNNRRFNILVSEFRRPNYEIVMTSFSRPVSLRFGGVKQ